MSYVQAAAGFGCGMPVSGLGIDAALLASGGGAGAATLRQRVAATTAANTFRRTIAQGPVMSEATAAPVEAESDWLFYAGVAAAVAVVLGGVWYATR